MRRALTVWRKEIVVTLRDQRTLVWTVALPLVLYPVLFVGLDRVQAMNRRHEEGVVLQLAIRDLEQAPGLEVILRREQDVRIFPVDPGTAAVKEGVVEALIEVPAAHENTVLSGRESVILVHYDATRARSRRARVVVEAALDAYRVHLLERRMTELSGAPALADAARHRFLNVSSAGEMEAAALGTLIPYLLVLLVASGASHTGIDVTAGEKERGTLETVLASAASRAHLVLGKFLATWTTALFAGVMGLLGLALAGALRLPAGASWPGVAAWTPTTAFLIVAITIPIAALLSAVFLLVGCVARGSREGHTYASYVIMIVVMLALLSVVIEIELTPGVFLVPVVGTALAQRQLLTGSGDGVQSLLSVASALALTGLALWSATRVFASERVLQRL